jgi:hypothetical protein
MARDRVVAKFIFEAARYDGQFIDPTYILTQTAIAALDTTPISFLVTEPILSTPLNDSSVVRVRVTSTADSTVVRAAKVDLFQADNIDLMEQTKPSASKPVVYRKGQTLYVKGLPNAYGDYTVEIDFVQAMIGSSTDYSVSEIHVMEITDMAQLIGEKELGILIVDAVNDGDQNPQK